MENGVCAARLVCAVEIKNEVGGEGGCASPAAAHLYRKGEGGGAAAPLEVTGRRKPLSISMALEQGAWLRRSGRHPVSAARTD